jgi:hypothetical protein
MLKRIVLKSIMAILLLHGTTAIAEEYTPIETFINNIKKNNSFVTVSNIWQADNNFDKTEMLKIVAKAQPLSIDYANVATFMQQKSTAINLVLPGEDGTIYTLELARYEILTNDFEVHEMGANNSDKLVHYTPGLYYRGVVKGIPGSLAAFSFFNNEIYGIFSIPNVGNFVVAPNTMTGSASDYNKHYILYNDIDLLIKHLAPPCGTDDLTTSYLNNRASKTTTILNNKAYDNCKQVRMFMTADYRMSQRKGGTTNCTNYITSLVNNQSVLFKNEGIMHVLKYVQVNTVSDPYGSLPNNSKNWLAKFSWVTQNTMHGCDLAQLLTTKPASMGGVAWLNTLCFSYIASDSVGPYSFCNIDNLTTTTTTAFPTYSWDVSATTHEIGHNLGSPHTHACVWNPPARNTAIDRCTSPLPSEGSCPTPSPAVPVGGGTIMSYCHFQPIGINLTKGFGQQPGDTIRHYLKNSSSSCGFTLKPDFALPVANRTLVANNECTDYASGLTYYWKDNLTLSNTDDTLVLIVKKNGVNIGDLNNSTFSVSTTTLSGYGGGTAVNTTFPAGTAGTAATAGSNYAMRRFWSVTPVGSSDLTTPVDVIFPFLTRDTLDVNGSVPGPSTPLSNYRMYSVKNTIDPNPANNFPSASAADIKVTTYGTSPSINNWILYPTSGSAILAYMKVNSLRGGGGFYINGAAVTSLGDINKESGIEIYPNPTHNEWNVSLKDGNNGSVNFQLYSADGRISRTQVLQAGTVNKVNAADLPAGFYFYRVISGSNVFTGNLIKN